jgi:hypothetical protein
VEATGPPRFLGNPRGRVLLSDPGGDRGHQAIAVPRRGLPSLSQRRLPQVITFRGSITRPIHSLSVLENSRAVFRLFSGMLAASLDNAIADHMDTIRWSDLLSTDTCLSSGIARLSGPIWDRANRVTQVCHLERIVPKARSPNWPYGRLDRAPLSVPLETTLGAPRRGAKTTCERWQDRSVASDDRDPLADNPPYCKNVTT